MTILSRLHGNRIFETDYAVDLQKSDLFASSCNKQPTFFSLYLAEDILDEQHLANIKSLDEAQEMLVQHVYHKSKPEYV